MQYPVTHGVTMARSQKRRLEVSTGTSGLGTSSIDMEFLNDSEVNMHAYVASVSIEPQDADANANGIWGVWVLPNATIQNADLPTTYGQWGDEDRSQYLWFMQPFTCSNQTPFSSTIAPKTSRNMARDSRVVLQVRIEGISAGLARINTTQTCYVTS